MKELFDNNFMGGKLYLVVNDDKTIEGHFHWYDSEADEFFEINAKATCHPDDKFSERKGKELVKAKIAREYHKMYLNAYAEDLRMLKKLEKDVQQKYEFRKKKVVNLEKDLKETYELTFFRNEPKKKTTKKKPATKTTPKK